MIKEKQTGSEPPVLKRKPLCKPYAGFLIASMLLAEDGTKRAMKVKHQLEEPSSFTMQEALLLHRHRHRVQMCTAAALRSSQSSTHGEKTEFALISKPASGSTLKSNPNRKADIHTLDVRVIGRKSSYTATDL